MKRYEFLPYPFGTGAPTSPNTGDGVTLTSAAHPRGPWYRWLKFWVWDRWRPLRLNPDSLETIEINIEGRDERS